MTWVAVGLGVYLVLGWFALLVVALDVQGRGEAHDEHPYWGY